MMVLVPILVAHVGSLRDVAYITAGQAVLGMLALAVIPLGLILLPSLTKMWEEDRERATAYVGELAAFACHVALFASLQTVIFADLAVRLWLGEGFDDATSLVRVTVAPAALFVVYIMLKATLDAVAVKSYNSRNSLIGFAVLAVLAALFLALDVAEPAMCVALAFAAALSTVGVLTFLTVHRYFGVARAGYALPLVIPLTVLTGALALAARPLVQDGARTARFARRGRACARGGVLRRALPARGRLDQVAHVPVLSGPLTASVPPARWRPGSLPSARTGTTTRRRTTTSCANSPRRTASSG